MANSNVIENTLKDACQVTDAIWAACIERGNESWQFLASYRLSKKRRSFAENYFNLVPVDSWLCGALAGGKARFRKSPEKLNLGESYLYLFPIQETQKAILVGAKDLPKKDKQIWRLLTNSGSFCASNLELQPADAFIFGGQTSAPYDLSRSLARILAKIVQYIPCEGAWLAIYGENSLKIEADWSYPKILGHEFSLGSETLFSKMKRKPKSLRLKSNHPDLEKIREEVMPIEAEVWGALPLMVGRRVIGVVALWRREAFSEEEWLKLEKLNSYVAASVEFFITFDDMANHLRRQAMLNDFALVVSSAQNLGQIVRRVFALLERTFGSELLSLF